MGVRKRKRYLGQPAMRKLTKISIDVLKYRCALFMHTSRQSKKYLSLENRLPVLILEYFREVI
jgi:hypothetical protein